MAIRGKTARACFDAFVEHLNPLVQATLPIKVPLEIAVSVGRSGQTSGILGFRGQHTAVVQTKNHGKVHVHLSQLLDCSEDRSRGAAERFQLHTRKYWYRIQAPGAAEAIVRWEYMSPNQKEYENKRWAWRHVQLGVELAMPTGSVDLNRVHLPTGFVIIEDIIRFLVNDLGVRPPCGESWHEKLLESERAFHRHFNTKVEGLDSSDSAAQPRLRHPIK